MSGIDIGAHWPIMDIWGNMIFARGGNVVLCYKMGLPELHSLSEKQLDALHMGWHRALKDLPVGTVVHKQDIYLKDAFRWPGSGPGNSFLARAVHRYFEGREHISHQCHLFFIWPGNRELGRSRYINPFKVPQKKMMGQMEGRVKKFTASVRGAVAFLNGMEGISADAMEEGEITGFTENYFNGFQQGATTDMVFDGHGVSIGDARYGAFSVNNESRFGEHIATSRADGRFSSEDLPFPQGIIDDLGLYLKGDHIVNQIIFMDDTHRWRGLLDKKIEELRKSSNFGSWNKVLLKKVEKVRERINEDPLAKIVRSQLSVIYWDSDREGFGEMGEKIKTVFRELDILPHWARGESLKHQILNGFPFFSSNLSNTDLYVGRSKTCALPGDKYYRPTLGQGRDIL